VKIGERFSAFCYRTLWDLMRKDRAATFAISWAVREWPRAWQDEMESKEK